MESEIIKLEKELRLAMIAGDVEKLDELISDTLLFTAPSGAVATKQMDLDAHRSKIQKISALNVLEQQIMTYDNFAVVVSKMELVGTYGEMQISGQYRYTRVWLKTDKGFKIVAGGVVVVAD